MQKDKILNIENKSDYTPKSFKLGAFFYSSVHATFLLFIQISEMCEKARAKNLN